MINVYGKQATPVSNDFIRAYSSGCLDNLSLCEYYLKRQYKKNTYGNEFSPCLHNNPFYFKHIELFRPIINPLFVSSKNNILAILLDMNGADLNQVLAYKKYMIIKDHEGRFDAGTIINYLDVCRIREIGWNTEVDTGAPAIQSLLSSIDLYSLHDELINKKTHCYETGKPVSLKLEKRIRVVEYFLHNYVYPERMIMDTMIIPNVEELINKDVGRVRSDIRTLYCSIVCRNERVKQLCAMACPDVIIHNETRMLQELVDHLFKKCYKLFGCDDTECQEVSSNLCSENSIDANFNFSDQTEQVYKIGMISLLFNLTLTESHLNSSEFDQFISTLNSIEDEASWCDVAWELSNED